MDEQAFLRCIRAEPADDTVRLVYADWLQENGDEARAEFIRLECELHKYPQAANWLEQMPVEHWTGSEEEGVLLRRLAPLVRRHTELCRLYVRDCAPWSKQFVAAVLGLKWLRTSATWHWGWTRGFVSEVFLPLGDFQRYAEAIFNLQPVERVVLPGVVRGGIVFRTSNGHENDIPREFWDDLQLPRCGEAGECRGRGTHAHMTEDELSAHLVAYGRKLIADPTPFP